MNISKQLLLAASLVVAALAANDAHAGMKVNGTTLQGMKFNGLKMNGPIVQGIQFNGISTNGPLLQGLRMNGLKMNGPVVQGMRINGIRWNGRLFNGEMFNGSEATEMHAAAPTSFRYADVRVLGKVD